MVLPSLSATSLARMSAPPPAVDGTTMWIGFFGKSPASPGAAAARRRTQKERRDEASRRIMDSAMALVCEKGVAGLTLSEAGERAGYSRGLAAHHYGQKEGLLVALVEQIGKDVRAARQQV